MNKKMKKLLTVLISVLMLLMLVGCSSGGNKNETPSETQTTETVEGRTAIVFKQYDGKAASLIRNNETQETYEGMRLMANDELVTDKDTTIYLRVDDDKNILLDKDTSMKIKELKDGKLQMELNYGAFFFDVENKLQDGEDMSFEIGGTTMSIRGTSGQGELRESVKSFSIFTGLGHVEDGQGMAVDLNPGVQVSTNTKDNEGRYRLSHVGGSDILDATKQYLGENKEYKNKVDDSKWVRELDGEVVDDSKLEQPTQKGWVLREDGSWIYFGDQAETDTQTNTNNNTGYRPPIIIPVPVYEPEEEEPAPAPTPEPTPEPKNICNVCGKEIVEGEEAKHALINSEDGIAYILKEASEEEAKTIKEIINYICESHHICELNEISYKELCKHVIHCSTETGDGKEIAHYVCEKDHEMCHFEGCENCNKTSELVTCEECGNKFCLDHISQCIECEKWLCNDCYEEHLSVCENCEQRICISHLVHCEHCNENYYTCDKVAAEIHITSCPHCGHYECESDFKEYHKYDYDKQELICNYPNEQQESIIELGD